VLARPRADLRQASRCWWAPGARSQSRPRGWQRSWPEGWSGGALEQRPDRRLGIVRDRRTVVEAEHGEGQVEQALDAAPGRLRVVVVLERDELKLAALAPAEQVGAQEHALLPLEQEAE